MIAETPRDHNSESVVAVSTDDAILQATLSINALRRKMKRAHGGSAGLAFLMAAQQCAVAPSNDEKGGDNA